MTISYKRDSVIIKYMTHSHMTARRIAAFAGAATAIALAFTLSAPQAHAESPNILVDANMTIGSTGQGVAVLQGLLAEMGYLPLRFNTPTGYFGPMTQKALGSYQAARGVYPTAGYFGPASKIAMHQDFLAHGWLALLGW
jgi:peptidoglycan hydrolase-like protein with peptidoglycan-binding domain